MGHDAYTRCFAGKKTIWKLVPRQGFGIFRPSKHRCQEVQKVEGVHSIAQCRECDFGCDVRLYLRSEATEPTRIVVCPRTRGYMLIGDLTDLGEENLTREVSFK